ncbi:MAG: response regulator, partial [Acetatifactor sp.]|nr:response regulator [Acetatifactor sp.]
IKGESRKVLVVDDSDFMRMMLEDILTHHGHTVLQAKGGQECLDLLRNETVDVCVLDIGMPGMDGLEVLRRIKEGQPGLKVVMLSALSQESNVRQALQLGADAFVVKPFGVECLIERVG